MRRGLLSAALMLAVSSSGVAAQLPGRVVVLTFDDAVSTHATFVAPLLKKYGFGATFLVCEFPPDFETDKKKYMTWEQIQHLNELGFEIGSHTRTHTHVTQMSKDQFTAELQYIEDKFKRYGIPNPVSFAYPAYETDPAAAAILKERGYQFARAGGSRTYDPQKDVPLLIPSFSTTGNNKDRVIGILNQARNGQIVVLTVHGVPDYAHPAVTTPPELFEEYLKYLRDNQYTVIAMRDLAKYAPQAKSRLPTMFIIGDSTVNNHTAGLMGWGDPIASFFDKTKITVDNRARGGRSSRTFYTEGLWDQVLATLQPGDFVLMQFGHNDGGPLTEGRARASLKGSGDETQEVTMATTGKKEVVHTYGWYLRQYIAGAKSKGATPIVLSPIPRNIWKDGTVIRAARDYGKWAAEAATAEDVSFIDLNEIIAKHYEDLGAAQVHTLYFAEDHTHTTAAGAELNAASVVEGLLSLPGTLWGRLVTCGPVSNLISNRPCPGHQ
jgi:peptidoglycan/xylan/chitin deacetylase (PgdA/CDA1 family)/lysophospholipase L1-like esterase